MTATTDRAAAATHTIMRIVADHLVSRWTDDITELRTRITEVLCDELDAVKRDTLNEIRLMDE